MTTETTTAARPSDFQATRDPVVLEAIEKMGGCTAAAEKLCARAKARGSKRKIGKTAVAGWVRVPENWVRDVRVLTGLPLKKLRPDLFDSSND